MLSATLVRNVNAPGCYGLTLRVKPVSCGGNCKSRRQSIRINGPKITPCLGAYPVVTLAIAQERAVKNAQAVALGRDPRRVSGGVPTFAKAAEAVTVIHAEN